METSDPKDDDEVKSDFIALRVLARRIPPIVEAKLAAQREIDHKGFPFFHYMALVFLMNQLHYLEDILALIPRRTAEVIARTMVEGLIKLRWVETDPEVRANRWFSFVWIQQWKFALRERSRGRHDPSYEAQILAQLSASAAQHLRPEATKKIERGQHPNPFQDFEPDWTGEGTYALASTVDLTNLYARFCDPYSDWIHWSPMGFLKSTQSIPQGVEYSFESYYQSVTTLVAAIASLIGCIRIWNRAAGIDSEDGLSELTAAFAPWSPNP